MSYGVELHDDIDATREDLVGQITEALGRCSNSMLVELANVCVRRSAEMDAAVDRVGGEAHFNTAAMVSAAREYAKAWHKWTSSIWDAADPLYVVFRFVGLDPRGEPFTPLFDSTGYPVGKPDSETANTGISETT